MKQAWKIAICQILAVLMAWTPFSIAQAAMIGTDHVVASTSEADRAAILGFVGRAEVASQLQSFGIDPATAKERVAAMTEEELRAVAGSIDALPAGGNLHGYGALLVIIIAVGIIWWLMQHP